MDRLARDAVHRLGDEHFAGDWVLPKDRARAEQNIFNVFQTDGQNSGLVFSDVKLDVLPRDNPRVPAPYLGVPDNAIFLVGSARIVAFKQPGRDKITNDIDKKDLEKLRDMTQKIWRKTNPKERPLKESELDMVIDRHGVEVIERMLNGGA